MRTNLRVYLSTSWKNRVRVRALADAIRADGHEVYDFTDPKCREGVPEIPPETFPETFNPAIMLYRDYITGTPAWRTAVMRNKEALIWCDVAVLMLPCGQDAHADAFFAAGASKMLVVCGQPLVGQRTPTHLWADAILDRDNDVPAWLNSVNRTRSIEGEVA